MLSSVQPRGKRREAKLFHHRTRRRANPIDVRRIQQEMRSFRAAAAFCAQHVKQLKIDNPECTANPSRDAFFVDYTQYCVLCFFFLFFSSPKRHSHFPSADEQHNSNNGVDNAGKTFASLRVCMYIYIYMYFSPSCLSASSMSRSRRWQRTAKKPMCIFYVATTCPLLDQ